MASRGRQSVARNLLPPSKRPRLGAIGSDCQPQSPQAAPTAAVTVGVAPSQPANLGSTADSISAAVIRYKAWKKAGAVHDDVCFECQGTGHLQHCVTCRRSYHSSCWPDETVSSARGDGAVQWFCDVCVNRAWHIEQPSLTPPPSPLLRPPSSQTLHSTIEFTQQNLPRHPEAVFEHKDNIQDYVSLTNPRGSAPEHLGPQVPNGPELSSGPSHMSESVSTEQTTSLLSTSARGARQRKSRYSTLSTEVDSALRVLYCEVELANDLRGKVTSLEAQLSQLRRELWIREGELALARKAGEINRTLSEELAQLRAESLQKQSALDEAAALKAKNQSLQSELEAKQTRLGEMTQTLQDWKQKLSVLVAD